MFLWWSFSFWFCGGREILGLGFFLDFLDYSFGRRMGSSLGVGVGR